MMLVLAGHYATERFAVERLAEVLQQEFADSTIWASRRERDPLHWC
jgi:putative NIF3 family GTP cyclohydrolase 1 type 2